MLCRKMLNQSGERTLIAAIAPRMSSHIDGIYGLAFRNNKDLIRVAAQLFSLPFDFFVKATGMSNLRQTTVEGFPILEINEDISVRVLLLSCLTDAYSELWSSEWNNKFPNLLWSKESPQLSCSTFTSLTPKWTVKTPLRTDYERRQALVELDVLVSLALGITLEQLIMLYKIQFPVLQGYEADTWYDANGRIVFTNNRSLTGVGVDRKTWENAVSKINPGEKYVHKVVDNTMPGGPVERTIEYLAPFDRCDREKDYETAWKFFEEKYGK